MAPIRTGTVLNFGDSKELRVLSIEPKDAEGMIKLTGSKVGSASVEFTGVDRMSHDGFS